VPAAALLLGAVLLFDAPTGPAAPQGAGAGNPAPSANSGVGTGVGRVDPRQVPAGNPLPLDDSLSLGDCSIQPASSDLAFRGWLTLGDLSPAAGAGTAGTPVYALVTAGTAEWVGWQTREGRPMYPRPVGRLGCAVDPVTSTATVFAVSDSWNPPPAMDGCPASPIQRHGGDRQVGGPGAFVLLPFGGNSWWADDPSVRIRVRIAPTPSSEARITATARPLETPSSLDLEVESQDIAPSRPPTSNHYVWLRDVRFPTDGCWLVSVSVDGQPVGAAILPVTRHPG
jgi:hypothetical protein